MSAQTGGLVFVEERKRLCERILEKGKRSKEIVRETQSADFVEFFGDGFLLELRLPLWNEALL